MEITVDSIAASIHDVTLSESVPEDRGHESLRSACNNLALLKHAIQGFGQATDAIICQARSVQSVADDVDNFDHNSIADVILLVEQTKKLTDIAKDLRATLEVLTGSTERCIVRQLSSLGNNGAAVMFGGASIQDLLSYFDADIRNIVRKTTNAHSDQNALWRVAVECYQQAASLSGTLHIDNYLFPREEASLEGPYDPDFESEEFYEHENRVDVDEGYATAYRAQAERNAVRRSESRRRGEKRWVDFWISALNQSPNGPTLFYPPAGLHDGSLTLNVPRYLFRTFDAASSGINDASVIASTASKYGLQHNSRDDILGLEQQKAAKLLHTHLTKSCFDGEGRDNLMSWTSSLLFAVQCAIWRAHKGRRPTSDVRICAVDTRKFPLGQFMRDISLLETYRATAEKTGGSMLDFFRFRLDRNEYYNGEYLSQGRLDHAGRSCMMSLEQLIQAGLYELYPEFNNAAGREEWANRVRDLRRDWVAEQRTTDHEIELAVKVGRDCFGQFELCDIASMILTLKNRRMLKDNHTSEPMSSLFILSNRQKLIRRSFSASFQETVTQMGRQTRRSQPLLDRFRKCQSF